MMLRMGDDPRSPLTPAEADTGDVPTPSCSSRLTSLNTKAVPELPQRTAKGAAEVCENQVALQEGFEAILDTLRKYCQELGKGVDGLGENLPEVNGDGANNQ